MSKGRGVAPGSDRRTVTVSFGYPGGPHTLVAPTLEAALEAAEARWGEWSTIEAISTPDTIYADLTGETVRRWQPGIVGASNQGEASKLRRLGRKLRLGEIGAKRYANTELPRTHRAAARSNGGWENLPSTAPNKRGRRFD